MEEDKDDDRLKEFYKKIESKRPAADAIKLPENFNMSVFFHIYNTRSCSLRFIIFLLSFLILMSYVLHK